MECSVCQNRVSTTHCSECRELLCEVCATKCALCGADMCLEHRNRDQHRRYVCARCVRLAAHDAAAPPPPASKGKKESLSFDALMEELGEEAPPPSAGYPRADTGELKPSALRDQGQFRILTASAPKPTPIWKSGLLTGLFAWVLLLLLIFTSGLRSFQPGISYVIVLVGGGTFFWNLYGVMWEKEKRERKLCSIGLILGLVAGLLAYWLRNMPAQPPDVL